MGGGHQLALLPLVIHIFWPLMTHLNEINTKHNNILVSKRSTCRPSSRRWSWRRSRRCLDSNDVRTRQLCASDGKCGGRALPAPGSVTQYAHIRGASVMRPRYFFFWASLAATRRGDCSN